MPSRTWDDLCRYAGSDVAELRSELKYLVCNMRYRLRHPPSKKARDAQRKFHRDLTEFADLIEGIEAKLKRILHAEHIEVHGFSTLWERFADYNRRYYSQTRPREQREQILETSIQEFQPLLFLLKKATLELEASLPKPSGRGRPRFPERDECAHQAVSAWLQARWASGYRGKDLIANKRNNGLRFVTTLIELGFHETSRSIATVENLAHSAISDSQSHAIAVSDFIEADRAEGLETTLSWSGFNVAPFDAYKRYMAMVGTPIEDE